MLNELSMVLNPIAVWIYSPRNGLNNLAWAMGQKIRQARQEAGLTQAELADTAEGLPSLG